MVTTRQKTVYIASDGKEFTDKAEAESYELDLNTSLFFLICTGPDLTEGRYCARPKALVKVITTETDKYSVEQIRQMIRMFMYKIKGNEYDTIMGSDDISNIMECWTVDEITKDKTNLKLPLVEFKFKHKLLGDLKQFKSTLEDVLNG